MWKDQCRSAFIGQFDLLMAMMVPKMALSFTAKKHTAIKHRRDQAKEKWHLFKFIKHCYIKPIPIFTHADGSYIPPLVKTVYSEHEITI